MELDNGSALKLTIARYFTPNGRSIQAEGIVPDIIVENVVPQTKEKPSEMQLREEDLEGHLENKKEVPMTVTQPDVVKTDYQKNVALGYLKSWDLFKLKSGL